MLNKIRLKLIALLLSKKYITLMLISLEITEEEYIKRYKDKNHSGYKSKLLKNSLKDIDDFKKDLAYMLGIKEYESIKY